MEYHLIIEHIHHQIILKIFIMCHFYPLRRTDMMHKYTTVVHRLIPAVWKQNFFKMYRHTAGIKAQCIWPSISALETNACILCLVIQLIDYTLNVAHCQH